MPYAVENALFQWEEGERRLGDASRAASADLDRGGRGRSSRSCAGAGSGRSFTARTSWPSFYAAGTDWADELASPAARPAATPPPSSDAAFGRYAREASNYAGGAPARAPRAASLRGGLAG